MPPYEQLIDRGFKIIRKNKENIETKVKHGGWSKLCTFSDEQWDTLLSNDKTLKDHE